MKNFKFSQFLNNTVNFYSEYDKGTKDGIGQLSLAGELTFAWLIGCMRVGAVVGDWLLEVFPFTSLLFP